MSAPSDETATSSELDSSRLSAAFGAAIGAVDVEGSDGDIDVGDASAAVPPPYVEGAGASVSIPGVNPGTSSLAEETGGGARWHCACNEIELNLSLGSSTLGCGVFRFFFWGGQMHA